MPKKSHRAGRPTAEQARKRHQELLDTSLDLFLKKGFELTTLDNIAAAMHMTKRTIYGLYANKEALFKAAVQRAIEDNLIPREELDSLDKGNLEETLKAVAKMRIAAYLSEKGQRLRQVINAESYRFPELLRIVYEEGTGPTVDFLKDLLSHEAAKGEIVVNRPEATAAIFLSIAVGAPARGMLSGGELSDAKDLDDHVQFCVHLFLNGLKKR